MGDLVPLPKGGGLVPRKHQPPAVVPPQRIEIRTSRPSPPIRKAAARPKGKQSATRKAYAEGYRTATVIVLERVQAMLTAGTTPQEVHRRLLEYQDAVDDARENHERLPELPLHPHEIRCLPAPRL